MASSVEAKPAASRAKRSSRQVDAVAEPDQTLAQFEGRHRAGREGHERLDEPDQPLEGLNIVAAITHSSSIHKHVYDGMWAARRPVS